MRTAAKPLETQAPPAGPSDLEINAAALDVAHQLRRFSLDSVDPLPLAHTIRAWLLADRPSLAARVSALRILAQYRVAPGTRVENFLAMADDAAAFLAGTGPERTS